MLALISKHMSIKVWDEISYSFPSNNCCAVEVGEWLNGFILQRTWLRIHVGLKLIHVSERGRMSRFTYAVAPRPGEQYPVINVTGSDCCLFCFVFFVLTHWGQYKMAAIFQTTFSNAFSSMKMFKFRLQFHWSLFPRVQLTIFQHWFR